MKCIIFPFGNSTSYRIITIYLSLRVYIEFIFNVLIWKMKKWMLVKRTSYTHVLKINYKAIPQIVHFLDIKCCTAYIFSIMFNCKMISTSK